MEIYEIVVSIFFVFDKDGKMKFFKQIFLLANVKPDIVFDIPFLIMSNVDIDF